MDRSEYNVKPKRILLHHPKHGGAFEKLSEHQLREVNFLSLPEPKALYDEYDNFVKTLRGHTDIVFLSDILAGEEDFKHESESNPNLIFMRDSSITLPWAPEIFIPTRAALPVRESETKIAGEALERLGLKPLVSFEHDEYIEGGDVLPVEHEGRRSLLIGFGVRTTKAAALKLALELIPHSVDQILGLSHDPDLLHLDTGFTVLPNYVILAAAGMFTNGFLIDSERKLAPINPIEYAEKLGFTIIRTNKSDAIDHERCNVLPVGENNFVAFDMPAELKSSLEEAAHITISAVTGHEISKGAGGSHCLTRPVYL